MCVSEDFSEAMPSKEFEGPLGKHKSHNCSCDTKEICNQYTDDYEK